MHEVEGDEIQTKVVEGLFNEIIAESFQIQGKVQTPKSMRHLENFWHSRV
jgi:hypothetical protein